MASEDIDSEENGRIGFRRRDILAGIAGGIAGAAIVSADSAGKGTDLGGNASESAAANFQHGGWNFSPSTLPPDVAEGVGWLQRDTGTTSLEYDGDLSLPHTWTASGMEWSIGSTISEAENAISSYPALAFAETGDAVLLYDDQVPITWESNGVRHVIASTLERAEEKREDKTPAVLWAADGRAEVVFDA